MNVECDNVTCWPVARRRVARGVADLLALISRAPVAVLFDFKAAFSSLSPDFLQVMLAIIGMPAEACNLVRALYHQ